MNLNGTGGTDGAQQQQSVAAGYTPRHSNGTRYGTLDDPNTPLRERRPGKSRNSHRIVIVENDEDANESYAG